MSILSVVGCSIVYAASGDMPAGKSIDQKVQKHHPLNREIDYSFGINPTQLLFSYYDYMWVD